MGKYVTRNEFVEFKAEMMNAVKVAIAEALAPAKKGNGKSGNEGKSAQTPEQRKAAFEQMKAEWAEKRANYKPSTKLVKAIKANQVAITHAIARDEYGFVGTKKDLVALKAKVCK